MNFSKKAILIILTASLVRVFLSAILDLGNDEVYYLLYGRYPAWNYFDHTALIGWVLNIVTFDFHFQHSFFYRLPSVFGAAICTWIAYKTGTYLKNERTGLWAAIVYNLSFYFSIIAGVFLIPDSIQLPFTAVAVYSALQIIGRNGMIARNRHFLIFGVMAGFSMLAKIHGLFLWVGFGGYILMFERQLLKNKMLWISLLISLVFIVPFAVWNFQNEFMSFRFHGERVIPGNGFKVEGLFRELAGEFAYQNPFIWIIILLSVIQLQKRLSFSNEIKLLLWLSFPILFTVWTISLFRDTLPHWTGPGYYPLIFVCALWLEEKERFQKMRLPRLAFSLLIVFVTAGLVLINLYPGTFGKQNQAELGRGDFTLDMYGWSTEGPVIAGYLKRKELSRYRIASPQWFPAAHIDEYIARAAGTSVYGLGPLFDIHQYHWINDKRGEPKLKDTLLYIEVSNLPRRPEQVTGSRFSSFQLDTVFTQNRNGRPARNFFIYRLIP
jgi:4-amino-4-deoxy-L-arabinose transferase-like glycosyltransferase